MVDTLSNVKLDYIKPENKFYAIAESQETERPIDEWASENIHSIKSLLLTSGAVLLRNFSGNTDSFKKVGDLFSENSVRVAGQISPRKKVSEKITTSTELQKQLIIPQHHEMAYDVYPPSHVLFYCVTAPLQGGETPIGDAREFMKKLNPRIISEFEKKGVTYIRNFSPHSPLKGAEETFDAVGKKDILENARDAQIKIDWVSDDHIRARQTRKGVRTHDITGDKVFFNDAALWHWTNVSNMMKLYGDEVVNHYNLKSEKDKWVNSTYGDGSPILAEDAQEISELYNDSLIQSPYEEGDILILDNVLVSHGRNSFDSDRCILASIRGPSAEPYTP